MDLSGYKLTFSDEFSDRSISQTGKDTTWASIRPEWRFDENSDIGFGRSSFVDPASGYDPFKVEDGVLTITAVPDKVAAGYPGSWDSGLIQTRESFSQTYGYFEMRADMSETPGAWDAFWMLPLVPKDGETPGEWQELDIVEHYGNDPGSTYRWIHTTDKTVNANEERQVTSWNPEQTQGFHTYGMDWQKDEISFYFDGKLMGSKPTPSDMDAPMYTLANLAVQDGATGDPMSMKIDYIRAYSKDENAVQVPLGQNTPLPGTEPPPVVASSSASEQPPSGQTPAIASEAPDVTVPAPVDFAAPPPRDAPIAQPGPVDGAVGGPNAPTLVASAPSVEDNGSAAESLAPGPILEAAAGGPGEAPETTPSSKPSEPQAPDSTEVVSAGLKAQTSAAEATSPDASNQGNPILVSEGSSAQLPAPMLVVNPAPTISAPAAMQVAAAEVDAASPGVAEASSASLFQEGAGGGSSQINPFLSLFNSASDESFKYVFVASSGPAAESMQRGGDVSSAIGDFLEGRGFGAFRAEGAAFNAADLLAPSGGPTASRYEGGGGEPGALVGQLAMDEAMVPVFVDHWTV
jgi:beta-glucanase (GH16 family)